MTELKITLETWGYVVIIENESGGKSGIWCPNFKDAFEHIDRTWNTRDNYIRIFPMQYKDRMTRTK